MARKNIAVTPVDGEHIEQQRIELVERKGIGHPDTIADGLSEAVSRALCREYRDAFGAIAHHNTDEVQIIGGKSHPELGGGTMLKPIYILLGGRATHSYEGEEVNVHGTAIRAAKDYLRDHLPNLAVEEDVIIDSRIGEGSSDLTKMYQRKEQVPLANDTSFGIGHAPLSETEKTVLRIEKTLNRPETKEEMPFLGEDIKVMGNRDGDTLHITVAAAFVDAHIASVEEYFDRKAALEDRIRSIAEQHTERSVHVDVNTADGEEEDELYLTVTGTSAEMGDDGSTGRGNRVSGLITPRRAMSLEASSGKNPVAHIGKIYNILSHYIADQVVQEQNGVDEAHVMLLSQIGTAINDPQIASIDVATDNTTELDDTLREDIEDTTSYWLDNAADIIEKVIQGDIRTY